MRSLLVCAAPVSGSSEYVSRLAPNADIVIAVDGGGAVCLDAGVLPDYLVGDLDSAPSEAVDELLARGVPIQRFPTDKNESDLELAIAQARRLGATEIVVTAATSGRLDHTLAVLAALAKAADMSPVIAEPDLAGWILSASGRKSLALEGAGSLVSLVAWGGVALLSARGMRWPLDGAELGPESTLGLSNEIASAQPALITVRQGTTLVFSPRDLRPPARISHKR